MKKGIWDEEFINFIEDSYLGVTRHTEQSSHVCFLKVTVYLNSESRSRHEITNSFDNQFIHYLSSSEGS